MSSPPRLSERPRRVVAAACLLAVGVLGFMLLEAPLKPITGRHAWKGLLAGGLFVAVAMSFCCALFSRSPGVRRAAAAALWFSLSVDLGYVRISGHRFLADDAVNIVANLGDTTAGLSTYGSLFLPGAVLLLPLVFGLSSLVATRVVAFRPALSLLTLPPLVGIGLILWWTAGALATWPAPVRVPALLLYQLADSRPRAREAPALQPVGPGRVPHLVLIVDESINATRLSLNGHGKPTTPTLDALGDRIVNFGIASSITNSSLGSQASLFSGVVADELPTPDRIYLRKPTLAQYAAQAGYHFTFLDAQDYDRLVAPAIDACVADRCRYRAAPDVDPRWQAESWLAEALPAILAGQTRTVTYMTKTGAHFPYEDGYPAEFRRFQPTLQGRAWSDDPLTAGNSYDNAVLWTVDAFLGRVTAALDDAGADVVLVYTSDHGQILPGSLPGIRFTHGNPDLPSDSASVPLLVWGSGSGRAVVAELADNRALVDNASHFEIFPTLLRLMGYPADEVTALYGASLFEPPPQGHERRFLSGLIQNRARGEMRRFELSELAGRQRGGGG